MARRKDFRRNYENLYPGIEKYPDVLSYLKKSDRKMEYMELILRADITFMICKDREFIICLGARIHLSA